MAGEAAGTEEHIHPEVETRDAKVPRRGSSKVCAGVLVAVLLV